MAKQKPAAKAKAKPKKAKPKAEPKPQKRLRRVKRTVSGGCHECAGAKAALWHGPNAHGVAVRHHDAKGHKTWVKVEMLITYGEEDPPEEQGEDAGDEEDD